MPRRPRRDAPGRLHHVVGRGQDRQRIFWYRRDYRFFLSLLVRMSRAGRLRLHAYTLMPNHYHLLVESVDGSLSASMQWVLGRYGAYFNATRDRSGHAFGERFHSFPITSTIYLRTVFGYIDRNPSKADAGMDALAFSWGSASHHATGHPRPRWLARDLVDRFLAPLLARGQDRRSAYRAVFGLNEVQRAGDALVEGRLVGRSRRVDPLDSLVGATPAEWEDWLIRRAEGPKGRVAPLALVDPGSVRRACADVGAETPPEEFGTSRRRGNDPWSLVETGLLRDLAGLTYAGIARLSDVGPVRVRERHGAHGTLVRESVGYRRISVRVARRALQIAFG